jgi:ubiquinone/menaquinone biosynthesis C-methylase UbiE
VRTQELTDWVLDDLGRRALDAARLAAGEAVLDIGCGCGATTLLVAERVGLRGLVVGVDVSAPMLARARERARAAGHVQVRFEQGDAQTHSLEARRYDALVSRFGVMFFDDPVLAFSHLRGSLRGGGRLAFVCWQAPERNPWIEIPAKAVAHLVPIEPFVEGVPGPFAFASRERILNILTRAGFAAPRVTEVLTQLTFPLSSAARHLASFGTAGRALGGADESTFANAVTSVSEAITSFASAQGVSLGAAAWVVTAHSADPAP